MSELIIIKPEQIKPYLLMNKHGLVNPALSLEAKGLLALLLSNDSGWKTTLQNIATRLTSSKLYTIKKASRELQRAGYLQISKARKTKGTFQGSIWHVYHIPIDAGDTASRIPTHGNTTVSRISTDGQTAGGETTCNKNTKENKSTKVCPNPNGANKHGNTTKGNIEKRAKPFATIPLPENFELTELRKASARNARIPRPIIARVFQKFIAYYRANGSRKINWDAAWEKWCLNEKVDKGSKYIADFDEGKF